MKAPTPQQIRTTRNAANLSQAATARLLGVTRMTIHNYEHGKTEMKPQLYDYFVLKLVNLVKDA